MNSWKKKVGLHLADQLRVSGDGGANGSNGEKLAYCVNPPVSSANLTSHGDDMAAQLRRKVSRVESLRKLLLGASHLDTRRLFDRKKYRYDRYSLRKVEQSMNYKEKNDFERRRRGGGLNEEL